MESHSDGTGFDDSFIPPTTIGSITRTCTPLFAQKSTHTEVGSTSTAQPGMIKGKLGRKDHSSRRSTASLKLSRMSRPTFLVCTAFAFQIFPKLVLASGADSSLSLRSAEKAHAAMLGRVEASIMGESALIDRETGRVFWEGGSSNTLYESVKLASKLDQYGAEHAQATILTCLITLAYVGVLTGWIQNVINQSGFGAPGSPFLHALLYTSLRWTLFRLPTVENRWLLGAALFLYFLESYNCNTHRFLANAVSTQDEVDDYIESLRTEYPTVTWTVRCFHFEKRRIFAKMPLIRSVFKSFKSATDLDDVPRSNHCLPLFPFTKKVVSHEATATYQYQRCADSTVAGVWRRSEAVSPDVAPFTMIALTKLLFLADRSAREDYFRQQSDFVTEHGRGDEFTEFITDIQVFVSTSAFSPSNLAVSNRGISESGCRSCRSSALHLQKGGVVITGSAGGIGYALAGEFLERGYSVLVTDIKDCTAAANALEIRHPHGTVRHFTCDVTDPKSVEEMASFARKSLGVVQYWVNNAGVNDGRRGLIDMPSDDIENVVKVNLLGTLLCTKAAIEIMCNQTKFTGHIFNTVGAGVRGGGTPGYACYGATKRGMPQLTETLVKELEEGVPGQTPSNSLGSVQVHNLSPGMVFTRLLLENSSPEHRKFPFGVLAAQPEEVAADLVPKMLAIRENGGTVEYLTPMKILEKFFNRYVLQRKSIYIDDNGDVIRSPHRDYDELGVRSQY